MVKPYRDEYIDHGEWVRVFDGDTDNDELVWHRDKNPREIQVLHGKGWQFQRDNEIPFIINTNSKFNIDAMVYHRLIKGDTQLILKIKETQGV